MHDSFTFDIVKAGDGPGTVEGNLNAIIVVRPLALVVESSLGVVAVLALALLYTQKRHSSQLAGDPASISDVLLMMEEQNPEEECCGTFNASRSRVNIKNGKIYMQKDKDPCDIKECQNRNLQPFDNNGSYLKDLIQPLELRSCVAGSFILILISAMIALTYTQIRAGKEAGLSEPSKNTVLAQLIISYLPVTFATFLEAF